MQAAKGILHRRWFAQEVGINTVYVQVRPAGDALYPSTMVPWSKVLTGIQEQIGV